MRKEPSKGSPEKDLAKVWPSQYWLILEQWWGWGLKKRNGSAGTRTEVPVVGAAGDLEITTWIAEGALVAPGRASVVWVMHFSPHKCGAIFFPLSCRLHHHDRRSVTGNSYKWGLSCRKAKGKIKLCTVWIKLKSTASNFKSQSWGLESKHFLQNSYIYIISSFSLLRPLLKQGDSIFF